MRKIGATTGVFTALTTLSLFSRVEEEYTRVEIMAEIFPV